MDTKIDYKEVKNIKDDIKMMHIAYLVKNGLISLDKIPLDLLSQKNMKYLEKLLDWFILDFIIKNNFYKNKL